MKIQVDRNKEFKTNEEYVQYLLDFICGKVGKILEMDKIEEKHYKILLDEGWYEIYFGLVFLTNFRDGKRVALKFENWSPYTDYHVPIYSRVLKKMEVEEVFEKLNSVYQERIDSAIKSVQYNLQTFSKIFEEYEGIVKLDKNMFILQKGDNRFVCKRMIEYCNTKKQAFYSLIISKDDEILVRNDDKDVVNYMFDLLSMFTSSMSPKKEVVSDIAEILKNSLEKY